MLRLYELLARKGIEVELVASDPPEDAAWAGADHAKFGFPHKAEAWGLARAIRSVCLHAHGRLHDH